MAHGRIDHRDEEPIVDLPHTIIDPDAVMIELVDTATFYGQYRSHFLQWREVFRT